MAFEKEFISSHGQPQTPYKGVVRVVGLPGLLMVGQVYLGYSTFWTVSIFTFALILNGAVTPGYLGNVLDLAPNFSAVKSDKCGEKPSTVRKNNILITCVLVLSLMIFRLSK